jgi:hypothetical protein
MRRGVVVQIRETGTEGTDSPAWLLHSIRRGLERKVALQKVDSYKTYFSTIKKIARGNPTSKYHFSLGIS